MSLSEAAAHSIGEFFSKYPEHPVLSKFHTVVQKDLETNQLTSDELDKNGGIAPQELEAADWDKSNLLTSQKEEKFKHNILLDLDCQHHYEVDDAGNGYLVLDYDMDESQKEALEAALSILGLTK